MYIDFLKRLLQTVLLLLPALCAAAPADTSGAPFNLAWHGFVNPHLWFDSRQALYGREEMMLFYPLPVTPDADGNDLNGEPLLRMLSITARLNLSIQGPTMLGARTRGYIEADFTGSPGVASNSMRLRHAYILFSWRNNALLAGQFWHPMVAHEVMPGTNPLNMGAPFHPYALYNQLRFTQRLGKVEALAVAAFQLDNKSQGPNATTHIPSSTLQSTRFHSRSLVPETNLQLRYCGERLLLGAAANMLALKPRDYVLDTTGGKHLSNKRFAAFSYTLFGRYEAHGWTLKAQTLLNDNLYECSTLGGYIETMTLLPQNGKPAQYSYSYKNWSYTTAWADLCRSRGMWRPGLFVGFAKNNDFGETVNPDHAAAYGRGFEIETLCRIQPRLVFQTPNGLALQAEMEYTVARYGKYDAASHAYLHDPNGRADVMRLSLGATYFF
ncbi:MAG: hypothetical protein SPJ13_00550 [Bacteroidales bacterium]|nr:hypothetical protein [Bacteroidales bacterium]